MILAHVKDKQGRAVLVIGITEVQAELLAKGRVLVDDCAEIGVNLIIRVTRGENFREVSENFFPTEGPEQ